MTDTWRGGGSFSASGHVFFSDYQVGDGSQPVLDDDGRFVPVFTPGRSQLSTSFAQRGARNDIRTLSFFLNDNWAINRHWSASGGVRYEYLGNEATGGVEAVGYSKVVPRLALAYDPTGNGRARFDVTYGQYLGRPPVIAFSANTNVQNPDFTRGVYRGPPGVGRSFSPGFDPANYRNVFGSVPPANVFFADSASAPVAREFTASAGTRLGRAGEAKLIYMVRQYTNHLEDFITVDTGATAATIGGVDLGLLDNIEWRNTDDLDRQYQSLQLLLSYRMSDNWRAEGHYTLQFKNDGNVDEGHLLGGSVFGNYEEILSAARHYPSGRLLEFQRHHVRLWSTYDLSMGRFGGLDLAAIYSYFSPTVYSLSAGFVPLSAVQQAILQDLPYNQPPITQTLFFGELGTGEFNDGQLLDFAATYHIPVLSRLEPYLKLEFRNLLNNRDLVDFN